MSTIVPSMTDLDFTNAGRDKQEPGSGTSVEATAPAEPASATAPAPRATRPSEVAAGANTDSGSGAGALDPGAALRIAEQSRSRQLLNDAERQRLDDAQAELERIQRETEVVPQPDEAPTKLGDGGVKLRYIGPSDVFDFGEGVLAYAGGDAVDVPKDVADNVQTLPHDHFEVQ